MKRYILTLLAVVLPYFCAQAQEHSIEIDASSFAAVQTDMISGVAIDKIGKDHSNRECARIKMRINRMTAAEIGELSVRPRGGNVEVMKCVVANEGNGLIIELTAKEPTTFYITHPKYGDSNVVSLNLEGSREYKINAELNISYPIFVNTNIVGADVYIDNLYMGRTNENYTLTAKDIQPGTHLLRLVHGNSSTERQIEVTGDNLDFRIEINTTTSRPQYVVFHVEPHSAVVLIDNKNYVLDADGYTQVILSNGTYSYQVSAKDYHSESGEFIVSGAKVNKNISLKPAFGWLNIAASGTLKDATIYVDDTLVGNTPINRYQLSSGSHHIRIVKNLYLTYEDNITIQDSEELNYSATLAPDFATVTIMADSGCDIYVNDVFRGKSPWSGTLSTGTYIFEARKLGHRTTMLSQSITAVPAQQSYKLDSPTPIIGTINVSCTPVAADLYVDDKLVGQTPMMHDLLVGEHKVTLRKEGYSDKSLNVTVTEGNVEDLNVTLAKRTANNREIKYTATEKVNIDSPYFGANITSHTWDPQSKIGIIKFDSEVTSIGYWAFEDCSSLKSITIPNSVTSIGRSAFLGCSSLTSITIPESVTSIGSWAFEDCSSLKSITIPNSVTSIGRSAFLGCSSLKSITIPESVTSIGSWVFEDCSSLTSITIPNSVTSIGEGAFYGCSSLTSINIPNNVTSIGEAAFYDCSSLTSITIPNSVTNIGDAAFIGCRSLTSISIPNTVTSIGDWAFNDCSSLKSITIPESVTSIGSGAFEGCSSLPVINNIRYADTYLVEAVDKSLTTYSIKAGTRFIGECAFEDCSSLTSITIPNSVISIGYSAFRGCSSLPVINNIRYADTYLVEAVNTSLTTYSIKTGTRFIGSFAFDDCSSLKSINIPNSVTEIGVCAFVGCCNITSFYGKFASNDHRFLIDDGVLIAFAPSGLTHVDIPQGITTIGHLAFDSCSSLKSITIPNSVTSIGWRTFKGCSSLTSINIPESVTRIEDGTFDSCSSLKSITIPNSVTSIGEGAFAGCSSLTSVYCKATTPPVLDIGAFLVNALGRKIYVPRNSVDAYKSASVWSDYAADIVGYDF